MKSLKDIDYAPLQDMDTAWHKVMRDMFKMPPAVTIGLGVILVIGLTLVVGEVALFLIVPMVGFVGQRVQARKHIIWKNFADANGWYVIPIMGGDVRFIPPGITGVGQRQKMSLVVHAQFEGHECDLFTYEFTVGSGRNRKRYYYMVARVILERPFPHLILDSKKTWALKNRGTATSQARLEGDFDQHFSLYYNAGEHIEALSVITPDVMRTLIDSNQAQDVEIIGQNLFFMTGQDERSARTLPGLLASVDALADEIAHKAQSISYSSPTGSAQAQALIEAARQSFASGERVMGAFGETFLFVFLLPFILALVIGVMTFLLNL